MQPPEVFRLLTRQMPRRVIIFQLFSLAFMACSIMALFCWHSFPWAITAFLTSFLSTMSWVLLRQKCIAAWKVSQNPQIVYWAHSREFTGILSRRLAFYGMRDYKILTLHLRDGYQSEFHLPPDDVRKFTDWLCAAKCSSAKCPPSTKSFVSSVTSRNASTNCHQHENSKLTSSKVPAEVPANLIGGE